MTYDIPGNVSLLVQILRWLETPPSALPQSPLLLPAHDDHQPLPVHPVAKMVVKKEHPSPLYLPSLSCCDIRDKKRPSPLSPSLANTSSMHCNYFVEHCKPGEAYTCLITASCEAGPGTTHMCTFEIYIRSLLILDFVARCVFHNSIFGLSKCY
jgi:hypothetical protein